MISLNILQLITSLVFSKIDLLINPSECNLILNIIQKTSNGFDKNSNKQSIINDFTVLYV